MGSLVDGLLAREWETVGEDEMKCANDGHKFVIIGEKRRRKCEGLVPLPYIR